ncbi:hypothetical protein HDV00_009342 [Rhizophlyctis rosea]|nr:hypothetical protein HDV00_009342 [Rhizophlyctis rosea]
MESSRTIGGRGLTFGRIFTRDGKLVASTAQEGVVRAGWVEDSGSSVPGGLPATEKTGSKGQVDDKHGESSTKLKGKL